MNLQTLNDEPIPSTLGQEINVSEISENEWSFSESLQKFGLPLILSPNASLTYFSAAGETIFTFGESCRCDRATDTGEDAFAARKHLRHDVFCRNERLGAVALCCPGETARAGEILEKLIDAALNELLSKDDEWALLEELSVSWECLQAVYDLNVDFSSSSDKKSLLNKITERATALGEQMQAVLWLDRGETIEPVAFKSTAKMNSRAKSAGLLGQTLAKKTSVICNDVLEAQIVGDAEPELKNARRLAIVPLTTRLTTYGVLVVWQETESVVFDSRTMRLLDTLALQAAMVVENHRLRHESIQNEKLKQEVEIGSKIQQTLLTGNPPDGLQGVSLAASSISSQQIDGDFYDFVEHGEDCFDLIIGDVMGKGIPAALVGAATKNCFWRAISQLQSGERNLRPSAEKIVTWVNGEVTAKLMQFESFVTACYARFDLTKNEVTFVDCGHTKTIHYRRQSGQTWTLEGDNMPLGFSEREIFKEKTVAVKAGDILFFFSDGVTETRSPDGEFFGDQRLAEFIAQNAHLEPKILISRLHQALRDYSQKLSFDDDLTCVAVRMEEVAENPLSKMQICIESDLRELDRVREFVRHSARRLPVLPMKTVHIEQLELAVNEAVTNVIKHAYGNVNGNKIELSAEKYVDGIRLSIHHWGEGFDPTKIPPPSFDGSRDGGFGLFIISNCVDSVIYSRDNENRNTIQFIKNPS